MATSEAIRLTDAHRAAQARRAATIAALVAVYYRQQVQAEDPGSIEAWLKIMIPRIMREHDLSAALAARYGDVLRRLELPNVRDGFRFEPAQGAVEEQIRRSLMAVGPGSYQNKAKDIRRLDEERYSPDEKQAMLVEAKDVTAAKIAGAVARHVQNGGRATIDEGVKRDRVALGWIRVTKSDPCYFCAMLASRGIEWGPYSENSFDRSDARFTGAGKVKVHDSCACSLKPAYSEDDPILERSRKFEEAWLEFSKGSGAAAIKSFRQGYEGRPIT